MPLSAQSTGTENGHEWVDLGLPSGLKWATCNIGAKTAEDDGNYYAWGEIKPKDVYAPENSITYGKDMNDISGNAQYDAATANWGGDWRMPTKYEMYELSNNCTWEWIKQNGVKGYKVTGPNGNSIFLPSVGYFNGTMFFGGSCGSSCYWSSTSLYDAYSASNLDFGSGSHRFYSSGRDLGFSVRPVKSRIGIEIPCITILEVKCTDVTTIVKTYATDGGGQIIERGVYWGTNPNPSETDNKVVYENEVEWITNVLIDLTPNTTYYVKAYATNEAGTSYSEVMTFTTLENPKEYDYVDLGLPSGLKWATCNIGANSPEEYGNYYAWGEVLPKETYTESNSETCGKSMSDISGTEYDAATVNWGDDWRMPTYNEMNELIDNCTWTWTTQNGVNGYKVASKVNSNYIFLPAAGYCNGTSLSGAGSYGFYCSSTPSSNSYAYNLYFNGGINYGTSGEYRYYGCSIRPVREVVEKPSVSVSVENYTDLTSIIKTYVSSSAEITERGFYWGTNTELSEADNKVVIENEVGYKVSALMNLTPNTTYYVKAYATNSEGTSYSEVVSFTTLETPVEYEYVDLGLPSGLKWATHNIGATTAEEYGNYYAWGEVVTKETYTEANSETYGKSMSDISGTEYDAATFNWSGDWRMPTRAEQEELLKNCTWTWTTQNGVNGYKVTSKINGNSIFLSAAGYRDGSLHYNAGSDGYYWGSTPYESYAYILYFNSRNHQMSSYDRGFGLSVRPVREVVEKPNVLASVENYTDFSSIIKTYVSSSAEITERGFYWGTNVEPSEADNKVVLENEVGLIKNALIDLTPNTTYYVKVYATNEVGTSYSEVVSFTTLETPVECEYVDLGLPSGLKWATHNIGATTPEEYGNYYAWGEVLPKNTYTEANSLTYGKSMNDISGTEYDAATVNWGGDWRMPTKTEMQELLDNCTWTWTTQNGVNGYKVTSKLNSNYIFLPAAGYRAGSSLNSTGVYGFYWSSTPYYDVDGYAYRLDFDSASQGMYNGDRYCGLSVRPVVE